MYISLFLPRRALFLAPKGVEHLVKHFLAVPPDVIRAVAHAAHVIAPKVSLGKSEGRRNIQSTKGKRIVMSREGRVKSYLKSDGWF